MSNRFLAHFSGYSLRAKIGGALGVLLAVLILNGLFYAWFSRSIGLANETKNSIFTLDVLSDDIFANQILYALSKDRRHAEEVFDGIKNARAIVAMLDLQEEGSRTHIDPQIALLKRFDDSFSSYTLLEDQVSALQAKGKANADQMLAELNSSSSGIVSELQVRERMTLQSLLLSGSWNIDEVDPRMTRDMPASNIGANALLMLKAMATTGDSVERRMASYRMYLNLREYLESRKKFLELKRLQAARAEQMQAISNEVRASLLSFAHILDERIRQRIDDGNRIVTTGLMLSMAIAGLLTMVLTRLIGRPLQEMHRVAEQIAGGDYSVRLPSYSEDELGELAKSFNFMAENLGYAQRDLQAYAQTLERKVNERTTELRRANSDLVVAKQGAENASLTKSRFLPPPATTCANRCRPSACSRML